MSLFNKKSEAVNFEEISNRELAYKITHH